MRLDASDSPPPASSLVNEPSAAPTAPIGGPSATSNQSREGLPITLTFYPQTPPDQAENPPPPARPAYPPPRPDLAAPGIPPLHLSADRNTIRVSGVYFPRRGV